MRFFSKKFNRRMFLGLAMVLLAASFSLPGLAVAKRLKITLILKGMNKSFFVYMVEGAKKAAKDLNIDLKCVAPVKPFNAEEQLRLMEDAITRKVDGIAVMPCDSQAIVPAIEKANKAGIVVTTPNTKAYGGNVTTWVGVENVEVGHSLATFLCGAIGKKGNVILIEGTPGASTSEERKSGALKAFSANPNVKLLTSQPANFKREDAMSLMENLLQRYPNIDGVLALDKEMAMGALEAIKAAGREKDIKIVGFDVDVDILKAVQDGDIIATGDQQPAAQAYLAVFACYAKLNGIGVPKEMYLPLQFVTKTNVNKYLKATKK
jgi:ribose transport system substrate-binding protein